MLPTRAVTKRAAAAELPGSMVPRTCTLGLMGFVGTDRVVLSISSPGVHLGDDAGGRAPARETNEFAAGLVRDHTPTGSPVGTTVTQADRQLPRRARRICGPTPAPASTR